MIIASLTSICCTAPTRWLAKSQLLHLQVFDSQLSRGVFPRGVELLFDKRRFTLALLGDQALPQARWAHKVSARTKKTVTARIDDSFSSGIYSLVE
jgi:hypothetical protein